MRVKMDSGGGLWACTAAIQRETLAIQAAPAEVAETEATRPLIMSRFSTA